MTFNENVQLDTSQATSGGSSGGGYGGGGNFPGGIQVGGGIGGLIVLILMFVFGGNVLGGGGTQDPGTDTTTGQSSSLDPSQVATGGSQAGGGFSQCKTGADANRNDECLVIATVNSVQAYWATALPQYGRQYTKANTVLYSGQTQSACGTASNQVGPFYCPLDERVYIDASFFQELQQRFGANGGQLAKEYVVAHEYGHHVQDILGVLGRAQQDPQGPESGSVRLELMADCLAGMWVKNATQTKDANGTTFLQPITQQDIQSALSAASAVGDDRIQKATQGRVNPESWTHGSSAQRQKWFLTGYQTGDLNQCNTFAAREL
ncbi:MAG TPA: neutral zinc metallopeptidase [Lapillicoccus sp.]